MTTLLSDVVSTLLDLGEERTTDEVALTRLNVLLKKSGLLSRSIFGHVDSNDDLGQQVIVSGPIGGYITARIFYDDFIEPLVIRKALAAAAPSPAGPIITTSCCLTNGTIQTGSHHADHNPDDPCPSRSMHLDSQSTYLREASQRRLFDSERKLALGVAKIADRIFTENKAVDQKSTLLLPIKLILIYLIRMLVFISTLGRFLSHG